jgi:hypothetical protein
VGFFPENVAPGCSNSEGCPVADMLSIALILSKTGAADYWDDADRWLRNYFAELQLTPSKAEALARMSASMEKKPVRYNETGDRVIARSIGAFAGWPSPNDWIHKIGIQHCCTGNCARAIYYAWESVVRYQGGELRVNLLLNHASRWADVHSHIPYQGRVDVKVKQPCERVLVRLPEWVKIAADTVACAVDDKPRKAGWSGRYLCVGKVEATSTVTVCFPIAERVVREQMGGREYRLIIKGNTVLAIDPPGKNVPLYQRDRYRETQTRWRNVNRFVSSEWIDW